MNRFLGSCMLASLSVASLTAVVMVLVQAPATTTVIVAGLVFSTVFLGLASVLIAIEAAIKMLLTTTYSLGEAFGWVRTLSMFADIFSRTRTQTGS